MLWNFANRGAQVGPKRRCSLECLPKRTVCIKLHGSTGAHWQVGRVNLLGKSFEHVVVALGRDHLPGIPRVFGGNSDTGEHRRNINRIGKDGNHLAREERRDIPHPPAIRGYYLAAKSELDWMSAFRLALHPTCLCREQPQSALVQPHDPLATGYRAQCGNWRMDSCDLMRLLYKLAP